MAKRKLGKIGTPRNGSNRIRKGTDINEPPTLQQLFRKVWPSSGTNTGSSGSQNVAPSASLLRPNPRNRRLLFLFLAFAFHLVYAFSIFDIYFVSPVVSGMKDYSVPGPAPAKRLVLFVADGLRADKAFQSFPDPSPDPKDIDTHIPRPLMPFIRSRILDHGTFGVSHTRVPTESRPGHVALIAGLYEDVSAVTTGWKLNPVNFDSVFNRSSHTWSWGSPDILPMFKEGAVPGRVDAVTYGAEAEDFTGDSTLLDTWVFDKVESLFLEDAPANPQLDQDLRQDQVVFFLHLLGLDTAGHAYRPYSKEYLHNIKVVDAGVQRMVELINQFYGDNDTAFVFTADHGMSDWGSHGDGHPDNTRTPLVAWGSGIHPPVKRDNYNLPASGHEDGFSHDWNLDNIQRNDVAQADIAPLMAYLIGASFPVNSVGELPFSYINAGEKQKASALLVNAKQILEMYQVKAAQKRQAKLRFVSFPDLSGRKFSPRARVSRIEALIGHNMYPEAIDEAEKLMRTSIEGLRYLQTYDWLFLRTVGTLGYIGWIVYALLTLVDMSVHELDTQLIPSSPKESKEESDQPVRDSSSPYSDIIVVCALVAPLFGFLVAQHSPWTYYGYVIFPVFFWHQAWEMRGIVPKGLEATFGAVPPVRRLARLVLYVTFLEALVYSYFERRAYSALYLIGAIWPFFPSNRSATGSDPMLLIRWVGSCIAMGIFTLLPAMKQESLFLIMLGGSIMFLIGFVHFYYQIRIPTKSNLEQTRRCLLGVRVGMIALAMISTWSSVTSLQARNGLPLGTQVIGWVTLVGSVVILPVLQMTVTRKIRQGDRSDNHNSNANDTVENILPSPTPISTKNAQNDQGLVNQTDKTEVSAIGRFQSVTRLMDLFITFSPAFIILTISYEGLFYISFFALLTAWVDFERALKDTREVEALSDLNVRSPKGSKNRTAFTPTTTTPPQSEAEDRAQSPRRNHQPLSPSDFRIALFFLFLIQSAFFSTGNLASVSSFSLDAVYRLIPVFDPISQGALLVLKLLIPFAGLSGAVKLIDNNEYSNDQPCRGISGDVSGAGVVGDNTNTEARQQDNETRLATKSPSIGRSALFMAVIALADVLTLHFFWLVRDEGSWLDIGTTISRFVIAEVLGLFVVGLEALSGLVV